MIKELKYLIYIFTIFLFVFFTLKFYFSNENKKNSYRSLETLEDSINIYVESLPTLKSDTDGIIEYVENTGTKNKKKYNFWKLLIKND